MLFCPSFLESLYLWVTLNIHFIYDYYFHYLFRVMEVNTLLLSLILFLYGDWGKKQQKCLKHTKKENQSGTARSEMRGKIKKGILAWQKLGAGGQDSFRTERRTNHSQEKRQEP